MELTVMDTANWVQFLTCIIVILAVTPLLGLYLTNVYEGKYRFLEKLEVFSYRLCGINHREEMGWQSYAKAILLFNLIGLITLFLLLVTQQFWPLNPENFPNVSWQLAFNIATSFVTNTNWQSYAGETTLSYASQMAGLAVQNFLSAATGMTVAVALIRGITSKQSTSLGNFWVDLVRTLYYLLIPLSIIFAIFLIGQGVIQNFSPYVKATTIEGAPQTIPMGPVASQIAIKQLGTNGGGFFNANSAHPFENPSALSNFFETLAIILIPAAITAMYGIMSRSKRHGWLVFAVMAFLLVIGLLISLYTEQLANPVLGENPVFEGKETRFGTINSLTWAVTTTATSNGSVNCMHSSLSPLAGGVALFNIMLGELLFGGIGVGLCSMLMFVLLTVFLSGLMVGRTPEYMGKKIERREMQWASLAILGPSALILIGASVGSSLPSALTSLGNSGPHGLSEVLYAFSSAAGNNGSSFAGLNANTSFYNLALGVVMLLARLFIIIPSLAIAGQLLHKKAAPPSSGTFSTETLLFGTLLVGVILIVGALTFIPALCLGPIVEQILLLRGISI